MHWFMLMMSSVNAFLPNPFSVSTVFMISPRRLNYISSTSLSNISHPRCLFAPVFSLLCPFMLFFFTIFIHVVCYISSIFFIGVSVLVNIPRKPYTLFNYVVCLISSSNVHYCFFIVSLCVALNMNLTITAYENLFLL